MDEIWIRDEASHRLDPKRLQSILELPDASRPRNPGIRPTVHKTLADITNTLGQRETLKADRKAQTVDTVDGTKQNTRLQQFQSKLILDEDADLTDSLATIGANLEHLLDKKGKQPREKVNSRDQTFQDICDKVNSLPSSSSTSQKHHSHQADDALLKYLQAVGTDRTDTIHSNAKSADEGIPLKQFITPNPLSEAPNSKKTVSLNFSKTETMNEEEFAALLAQIDTVLQKSPTTSKRTHHKQSDASDKEAIQRLPVTRNSSISNNTAEKNKSTFDEQSNKENEPLKHKTQKPPVISAAQKPSHLASTSSRVEPSSRTHSSGPQAPPVDYNTTKTNHIHDTRHSGANSSQTKEMVRKPNLKPEQSFSQPLTQTDQTDAIIKTPLHLDKDKQKPLASPGHPSEDKPQTSGRVKINLELDNSGCFATQLNQTNQTKSILKQPKPAVEMSDFKRLNTDQKDELNTHLMDLKLAELKGKMSFILSKKPKDSTVLLKLVIEILHDFLQDKVYESCFAKYSDTCTKVTTLMSKSNELNRILKAGQLHRDEKFNLMMIDNILGDVKELFKCLSPFAAGWSSVKPHSEDLNSFTAYSALTQKHKNKEILKELKEEDLDLYVKKSDDPIMQKAESVNSRIDFNRCDVNAGREPTKKHASQHTNVPARDQEPVPATRNKQQTTEDRRPETNMMTRQPSRDRGFDNVPNRHARAGHERHEDFSRKPYEVARQQPPASELLLTQKFGCRIYSMRMVQKTLVCGFEDGSISVFSINHTEGLNLERSNKLYNKPISAINCTPSHHKRLLLFTGYSSSTEASIIVWDYASLKPLKELCGHSATVSCLEYMAPNYLISGSFDRKVIFWDLNECEAVLSTDVHHAPILTSYFDSESSVLYTGSLDSQIVVSGLMLEDGELADCKILKQIQGVGPVLYLTHYLGDKLLSFQNSKLLIYDSRGILFRELKTNTLPNMLEMTDEDRGIFVDVQGKPHSVDMTDHINLKKPIELSSADRCSMEKSSILMGMRLNGAYCKAQLVHASNYTLVISTNEKSDSLYFHKIK